MDFNDLNLPATRGDLLIAVLFMTVIIILLTKIDDSIEKQNKWLMEEDEIDKVGKDVKPEEH